MSHHCFQPGEGPSRGLLRDYTTSCGTDGALHSTSLVSVELGRDGGPGPRPPQPQPVLVVEAQQLPGHHRGLARREEVQHAASAQPPAINKM